MSDANGNGHSSRGVQAYRWVLSGGIALLGVLLIGVLNTVNKTADAVGDLRERVATLAATVDSRFNAHADRLRGHDVDLHEINKRLYEGRKRESPP